MVTRKPLIVNASANQIQELPAGDSVDGIATLTATTLVGNGVVPVGGIIMWSGTVSTIPSNFKLCDGNNNTPNLTNKFIIGAISDQSVSGITTAATTITGSNTRDGGTKDAVIVSHTHELNYEQKAVEDTGSAKITDIRREGGDGDGGATTFTNDNTSGFMNSAGVDGTNQNLPPYYALAFIMRVS